MKERKMKRRVLAFLTGASLIVILGMGLGTASGATLFSDDFEDGNASGWSTSGGSWSVVTDGSKVDKQSSTSSNAYSYTGNSSWTDYAIQARVKALAFNGDSRTCGVVARYQSTSNHYYFTLGNDQQLRLGRKSGGSSIVLTAKPFSVTAGTWYTLKLSVTGNQLQGYVDGQLQLTATDTALGAGRVGLVALSTSAAFDDILVTGTATGSPSPTTTPTALVSPSVTPVVTPTVTPSSTPVITPTASIPTGADIVVAQDGSGDCSTIGAALDRIPADNDQWVRIYIKNGVYPEHIFITKSYVALIGEDRSNTRIELALNRAEWNKATGVTNTGSGVINLGCTAPDNATKTMTKVTTTDVVIGNLTVENTAAVGSGTVYTHAIRGESSATRISVISCNVYGMGSDTLALWNTTTGMYYHADCTFKGRIDAICPRGWCYDVGSTYIEVGNSAPIWHEGLPGSGQKFVIRNAYVKPDIAKNFSLLNGQKESTVYLLDSYFYNSAGKSIKEGSVSSAYFYNCHMEGGDQSWHANNLASAPGSPAPSQITAQWTFNNQWDPENTLPAVLPYAAIPQPWNKAAGITPSVRLKWVKAKAAVSYNIYLGTTPTPAFVTSTSANTYQPAQLTRGTTYYWRVDAVTAGGVVSGPVWSFTVASN